MDPILPFAETPPPRVPPPGPSASTDFDMFLTLLTTQIRNQDPLEPADSTEYTAQLATFSGVEQAVQTNDLLRDVLGRLELQQANGAAAWIGMEVRHAGPIARDGGPRELGFDIPPGADAAELVISDPNGTERARRAIDPKATTLTWPDDAPALPPGTYRLHVEPSAGAQSLTPVPVAHYAAVEEVLLGPAGVELGLAGGLRIPASSLDAIRRPAPG
ncbi:flagellar hook capping FlgD N-terminal domain-containing protein [Jannaschia ovalis]|uniref:Basal-body rod modification protein FlgD n=1 Tax=Jannaschia ovalis TaxID=3038773 RepID=A0ABY8L802_9RHOB|nr:flagellar hook capping FlgD N-terminal domain-containing protein [Jannaschia sp. GRR-S6-38]WGH77502.1 flagellar hook capping FlgD N-terminal domain-containing protein [Jannaschia sp. GRR-S6-38]